MISEDAFERKAITKKRAIVAGMLLLAATGTHWLPGRTIVAAELEPQQKHADVIAADSAVAGPNSLFGDAIADETSSAIAGADLSGYHLDTNEVVDQAGLSRLLNGMDPMSTEIAIPAGNFAASDTSAVPEPKTAGLFILAAAPIFIRRKGRQSVNV